MRAAPQAHEGALGLLMQSLPPPEGSGAQGRSEPTAQTRPSVVCSSATYLAVKEEAAGDGLHRETVQGSRESAGQAPVIREGTSSLRSVSHL